MKTYNEIDIKYYDNDGNIQVRCSAPVTQDALVHYELMQSHYCKLSFKLSKPIYFLLGDFIDTPYGRFELIDLTKAKDNDTIGYSYEIQFLGEKYTIQAGSSVADIEHYFIHYFEFHY